MEYAVLFAAVVEMAFWWWIGKRIYHAIKNRKKQGRRE